MEQEHSYTTIHWPWSNIRHESFPPINDLQCKNVNIDDDPIFGLSNFVLSDDFDNSILDSPSALNTDHSVGAVSPSPSTSSSVASKDSFSTFSDFSSLLNEEDILENEKVDNLELTDEDEMFVDSILQSYVLPTSVGGKITPSFSMSYMENTSHYTESKGDFVSANLYSSTTSNSECLLLKKCHESKKVTRKKRGPYKKTRNADSSLVMLKKRTQNLNAAKRYRERKRGEMTVEFQTLDKIKFQNENLKAKIDGMEQKINKIKHFFAKHNFPSM